MDTWPVLALLPGQDRGHATLGNMAKDLASAAARWRAARQAVDDAKVQVKQRQDQLREARAELAGAIVAEAKRGTRMRDLVAATGLSREWIRTVLRQNGIMADD